MRNAVVFALGTAETQLGLASAARQAERLETDDYQRISALTLRKVVQLEQGDTEGAERLRKQAEVLSLQQRIPQMFNIFYAFEAFVYSHCNNLAGLTQTIEHVKPLTERYPAWLPVLLHAEGSFQLVRGDYQAARAKFESAIALDRAAVGGARVYFPTWISLQAGLAQCLLGVGRVQQAREVAATALRVCEARGSGDTALELIQVLALTEATLGDARGAQRLDALIARQNALGVTGLRMGLSYEARARVAIWTGDATAFERYSELTALEYRHGARTPLAARYERLMNEATRAGMQAKLTLANFHALGGPTVSAGQSELLTSAARLMAGSDTLAERALIALETICTAHAARAGYLFLLTPAGPVLQATHRGTGSSAELGDYVSAYVADQQRQATELDDMATDAVDLANAFPAARDVQGADRSRELLPLRCKGETASVLVGVVVLETLDGSAVEPQAEVLSFFAARLHAG